MRIRLALLLSVLLPALLIPAGEALAAGRALLLLGDFEQWVDLLYTFDRQTAESRNSLSTAQHYLREEYHFSTAYALLDPRILRGKLNVGLGTDQDFFTATNTPSQFKAGTDIQYNLTGAVLERSPYPLHFFSQYETVHAQREFGRSTDIDVARNGFIFMLKNRILPVKFDYSRSTSETSETGTGGRAQTSDTATLSLNHRMPVSDTDMLISILRVTSKPKDGGIESENRTSSMTLHNQLRLSETVPGRVLSSRVELREEVATPDQDFKTVTLDEQFLWPLGKALTSGASFLYTNRDGTVGTENHQDSRLWLQHRLFNSLSTVLNGEFSKDRLIGGSEQNVIGAIDLLYQKDLPSDSKLRLNFIEQYQVTDRSLLNSTVAVLNEAHTAATDPQIPSLFTDIPLRNMAVLPETIIVTNADPRIRLLPYVPNVDYAIRQSGLTTLIVILPGSEINPGNALFISYSYQANPQIKYSTNSQRVGFNLTLFRNTYSLTGSWSASNQNLISGRADNVRLTNDIRYFLGFEGKYNFFSYGGEYENIDSDIDRHQTILGFVRYTKNFYRSSLALYLTDSYTVSKPPISDVQLPESKVTSFSAGGTYSSLLFSTAQLILTTKYINLRGDTVDRDDICLGANLRWSYGKLSLSLVSQMNWKILPGTSTADQSIRLHLIRAF
ncbi:hypothetical protein [Geobacter sp. SVR]|uniref:hypothetical protein n=1 Tax=Geobacter sp. SVR TaxID=2495594 RepID=UPI00143EFA4C|nr:hypothetical protein [Geobacter sp. SVR]BCS53272.1 hypothetical protein GSVR_15800 [Geobacter sp. SVR]GCF85602.1 hypothetical protein GSbR_22020 [Geobacter sp. SVR]